MKIHAGDKVTRNVQTQDTGNVRLGRRARSSRGRFARATRSFATPLPRTRAKFALATQRRSLRADF